MKDAPLQQHENWNNMPSTEMASQVILVGLRAGNNRIMKDAHLFNNMNIGTTGIPQNWLARSSWSDYEQGTTES